jgi:SOS response regulatory protein OraA/RecX
MDGLSEEDFSSHCADVIRKKYREIPEERGARQKMTAALMRLGYDMEHIREAVAICRGTEE